MPITSPVPGPRDQAVHRLVLDALEPYGADAAQVDFAWGSEACMWFTEVRPRRRGAAFLSVAVSCDDWNVVVGNTWFEVYDAAGDLGYLSQLVKAAVAGRVQEAGPTSRAFARIFTEDGPVSVGHVHLPIPWKWRRVRAYRPYADL